MNSPRKIIESAIFYGAGVFKLQFSLSEVRSRLIYQIIQKGRSIGITCTLLTLTWHDVNIRHIAIAVSNGSIWVWQIQLKFIRNLPLFNFRF